MSDFQKLTPIIINPIGACIRFGFLLHFLVLMNSCEVKKDYYNINALTENGTINCVIEIPAGTNIKYEYNPDSKVFEIDQEAGHDRIIDFLPYPANYGFIPSTISNPDSNGDGDALDVLVIAESIQTGTLIECRPLAILKLLDNGEIDNKVIAIPAEENLQIIDAADYSTLISNYKGIFEIIEIWFTSYNKNDTSVIVGWDDEKEALKEIQKSVKN